MDIAISLTNGMSELVLSDLINAPSCLPDPDLCEKLNSVFILPYLHRRCAMVYLHHHLEDSRSFCHISTISQDDQISVVQSLEKGQRWLLLSSNQDTW